MKQFKKIAYLCDVYNDDLSAAKQALSIANDRKGELLVWITLIPLPDVFMEYHDALEVGLLEKAKQRITTCAEQLQLDLFSIRCEYKVIQSRHPALDSIKMLIDNEVDLLIKAAEDQGQHMGFSALDMSLLRKCPVPIWLCRPIPVPQHGIRVAVAIDPREVEGECGNLSKRLLELGCELAQACSGVLTVVSCWELEHENLLRSSLWLQLPKDDIQQQVLQAKQEQAETLETLLQPYRDDIDLHFIHGKPQAQIPEFVKQNSIDILLMGTVGRTGIPGWFIGNTAEDLLNKLSCTLVAVKPERFASPLD